MKISPEDLVKITFANAHRLPTRQKQAAAARAKTQTLPNDEEKDNSPTPNSKGIVPNPVIVKFVTISDRNMVLKHAKNIPKERGIIVKTDLPNHLKEKRYQLGKIAYDMRTKEGLKTFIKEINSDVILLFRRDENDKWQKYNYFQHLREAETRSK